MNKKIKSFIFMITLIITLIYLGGCWLKKDKTKKFQITNLNLFVPGGLVTPVKEITSLFEKQYPMIKLTLITDSCPNLRKKIEIEGNQTVCDLVFLDQTNMSILFQQGLIDKKKVKNICFDTIVVAGKEKKKLKTLSELTSYSKIIIGDYKSGVLCGKLAVEALEKEKVWNKLKEKTLLEPTVKAVKFKLEEGEAPVGILFNSELFKKDKLHLWYKIPFHLFTPIKFQVSPLKKSSLRQKDALSKFIIFLSTPQVEDIWKTYGYLPAKTINKITVLLAASLISPLKEIKKEFEKDYPFWKISLISDSSSALRRKIELENTNNNLYDIFLSANYYHAEALKKENLVEKNYFKVFAKNSLVVISSQTKKLNSPFQLLNYDLIAIGDYKGKVPCGVYAYQYLKNIGLWDKIKNKLTLENTVKTVLMKVKTGAVSAGFVYSTDLYHQKDIYPILNPEEGTYPTPRYTMVILKNRLREAAKTFYFYLDNVKIKNIFKKYGFKVEE